MFLVYYILVLHPDSKSDLDTTAICRVARQDFKKTGFSKSNNTWILERVVTKKYVYIFAHRRVPT